MTTEDVKLLPLALYGAARGVQEVYLKDKPGLVAWGALAAGVTLYDTWAIKTDSQTMSNAFHEGMAHPVAKYMCIGLLGATSLHLAHVLPPKYDIFYASSGR